MKTKILFSFTLTFILVLFVSSILYTYPTGISGRTKKSGTSGCSCHGSSATQSLPVTISGPDSLAMGMTASYTLTITSATGIAGGLDVATRSGVLAVNQTGTKLLSGELVHSAAKNFTSGACSFTFNYTAPNTNTLDTIFSTGLSSLGGTSGSWNWGMKQVKIYTVTGTIQNTTIQPDSYSLGQNFPNPFNPVTSIVYSLRETSSVQLQVFDMSGKIIRSLVNSLQNRGEYKVDFDANKLASGIYYYTLRTKDFTETKSMVLIK